MKLLFGKPELRKAYGVSLCDECYDPMYDFLEKNNIPVLLHSNDPVEFWDKERIPKWAIGAGYYCDETYPTHEQIREETIGILKKHPKLNLTIAHIFFLSNSDRYDLAEEYLPIALEWTKRMYPDPAEQEKIKEKLLALVEK